MIASHTLRFGCRLLAYVGATVGNQSSGKSKALLLDALVNNTNALRQQSAARLAHPLADRFHLTSPEEVLRRAQTGNVDGWGIARFDHGRWQPTQTSMICAARDPNYVKTAQSVAQASPETVLAHLLEAPPTRQPSLNNLHPFRLREWTGMLNGGMRGFMEPVQAEFERTVAPLVGSRPKGETPGELGLYMFVGRLLKEHGTSDVSQIGLDAATRTFAHLMKDLRTQAKQTALPTGFRPFLQRLAGNRPDAHTVAAAQRLTHHPQTGLNFILSDGNHLLAFRSGRSLFIGERALPGQPREVLVTSEPLANSAATQGFRWQEVPEDTIVTVRRDATLGAVTMLSPLARLVSA